jgi:hypothetical protein
MVHTVTLTEDQLRLILDALVTHELGLEDSLGFNETHASVFPDYREELYKSLDTLHEVRDVLLPDPNNPVTGEK